MAGKKTKKERRAPKAEPQTAAPADPWDSPVRGTRDAEDSETVRIPVEVIDDFVEDSLEAEPEPEPVTPDPRDTHIAELELRLAESEQLLEQTRAAYRKREKEMEATRARLERDREKHLERSRTALLERLFEPMDNLSRSVASAGDWADKDERITGFLGGLEMVERQLRDRMEELGLVRFDPTGETFDPYLHEAISTVPVKDKAADGKVHTTWEVGYRCGDVVLRAAKVIVGKRG